MTQTLASSWWTLAWRRVGMRLTSAWRPRHVFVFAPPDRLNDMEATVAAFGRWCASHEGAVCTVGLSSRWLLSSVADPALAADAARLQAMQQWAHYLDLDEAALASAWVLRQVKQGGVSVVSAAPRALIDGLRAQAALHAVQLQCVGPWWAHAVQSCLPLLADVHAVGATGADTGVDQTLRLIEPGLVTCVQASRNAKGEAVLHRIWVEQGEGAPDQLGAMTLSLPSPLPSLAGAGEAARMGADGIWDHAAMRPLLTGDDMTLQVAA